MSTTKSDQEEQEQEMQEAGERKDEEDSGAKKGEETHINIKVVNGAGNEVYFKIKKTTSLRKLMKAYCKREGLANGSVRFSFDGNRVTPDNTPTDLDMENEDVIDALVEQIGGRRRYNSSPSYFPMHGSGAGRLHQWLNTSARQTFDDESGDVDMH